MHNRVLMLVQQFHWSFFLAWFSVFVKVSQVCFSSRLSNPQILPKNNASHVCFDSGRAGVKGTAYTFVTDKDKEFAGHIVRNLEAANQDVSKELMDLVS